MLYFFIYSICLHQYHHKHMTNLLHCYVLTAMTSLIYRTILVPWESHETTIVYSVGDWLKRCWGSWLHCALFTYLKYIILHYTSPNTTHKFLLKSQCLYKALFNNFNTDFSLLTRLIILKNYHHTISSSWYILLAHSFMNIYWISQVDFKHSVLLLHIYIYIRSLVLKLVHGWGPASSPQWGWSGPVDGGRSHGRLARPAPNQGGGPIEDRASWREGPWMVVRVGEGNQGLGGKGYGKLERQSGLQLGWLVTRVHIMVTSHSGCSSHSMILVAGLLHI